MIDDICRRVSNGETLNEVCRDQRDFGYPPASTFRDWVIKDTPQGVAVQYTRARELQWEYWADHIREESSKPKAGEVVETDAEGKVIKVKTGDTVDRSRLSVDSMKWLLSKLAPKKYGDRVQVDATHGVTDPLAQLMREIRGTPPPS